MAIKLVKPNDVEMPSKAELTSDNNLAVIQANLRNYLAWYHSTGVKTSKSEPRNLIVIRSNGRNLAIKISNHTWNLVPLDDRDDIEQIQEVIEELPKYKDSLFEFKKWCNQITGVKDGATKHPRPQESF